MGPGTKHCTLIALCSVTLSACLNLTPFPTLCQDGEVPVTGGCEAPPDSGGDGGTVLDDAASDAIDGGAIVDATIGDG